MTDVFIAHLVAVGLYALPLLGVSVLVSAGYWLGYRRGHFVGDRDRARLNVREAYEEQTGEFIDRLVPEQRGQAD